MTDYPILSLTTFLPIAGAVAILLSGRERLARVVETPVNLTRNQKVLLREFAEEYSARQSPRQASWLDGVKNFVDSLTD